MARSIRRYVLWLFMLTGCSSQPFCDFQDTAPIIVLPVPDNVSGGYGWGSIMVPMSWEVEGNERDHVAVAGGPGSQIEVFNLADGAEMNVGNSQVLTAICDRDDADDEDSTCYDRLPGAGLAYRSRWDDGENCLAVGFAGHDSTPSGFAFWCANGTRHRRQSFLITLEHEVRDLAHVLDPEERMFISTDRALYMLEGDATNVVRLLWDYEGLPHQSGPMDDLSVMQTEESPNGHLVAIGFANDRSVVVAELYPPAEGESDGTLVPRACVTVDEPNFGTKVLLTALEPDGEPYLLAGSRWGTENRVDAMHIFELDLSVAPEDVSCVSESWLTLSCPGEGEMPDDGSDIVCPSDDRTGFGTSFDVGDIDDTEEYELIVGCPGCEADGMREAGAAFVYRPLREGDEILAGLTDSGDGRGGAQLGVGVGIVEVGDRQEPLISAQGERTILMFLCTGVGDASPEWDSPTTEQGTFDDPRCRD